MKKVTEKKKFRLKKSARLTIAGVCAATAVVVAVIPTKNMEAITPAETETQIPTSVDDVLGLSGGDPAIERLVGDANTVEPSDSATYWAFPMGDAFDVTDSTATIHKYYKVNREGMFSGYDAMPIFEISSTTTPGSVLPQCIKHYVGGDGSGYTPSGGVLKLSPAVIYVTAAETASAPYMTVDKGDPVNHTPYTWKRYTETKVTHDPNDRMIDVYGTFDQTPKYYYYNILVETWTRQWGKDETKDPADPAYWIEPTDPTGDQPDGYEQINEVCKQQILVQYIANGAFKGVANFTQMDILDPEGEGESGITHIGDEAFMDCTSLQSVSFGRNFKYLGTKAFYNCTGLQNVNFGMSTLSVGDGCFGDCTQLSTIALPKTLTQLGTAAFMNCRSLTDSVPDFHNYDDYNSVLFAGNPSTGEMGINNNLATGSYAFCNCTSLTTTKMCQTNKPITGTYGQYGMYAGCTNLRQIELPHYTEPFQTTKSMFLGCPNLECVRSNQFKEDAVDRQFINNINKKEGENPNVSDSFVLWGPNPKDSSSIKLLDFAYSNSLPYMYWDNTDQKFKYIMVQDDTYKFTFTDDFIIESITEVGNKESTLRIPSSIGGHDIKAIANDACGKVDHGTYVSNLSVPTKIEIADSIATIGENAFRNCPHVKEVDFVHIPFTTSAAQTSIGASCFKDCEELDIIKFRDDNFGGNGYYDINIDSTSVGTDAFLTENPNGLTIYGKMEQGYWPYEYALDPSNISCSTKADSYITYHSGNPQNLVCKYSRPDSSKPGYVSLLKYPTINTVVGTEAGNPVTISDLIDRYLTDPSQLSPNQESIINSYTRNIYVPYGITSILDAENDLGAGNDYFIATNDDTYGFYDLTNLTFESLESLPVVPDDPKKPFSECRGLQSITFNSNIKDIGVLPFYNQSDLVTDPLSALTTINFNGENDKATATIDDPYYWYDNGIIYSYYVDDDGNGVTTLEEVLQSRGEGVGSAVVDVTNDPSLAEITDIAEEAFKNCDHVSSVDLTGAEKLQSIPEQCFFNGNQLKYVTLPSNIREVQPQSFQENPNLKEVTVYSKAINVDEDAFGNTFSTTLKAYEDSSIPSYVKMVNKKDHRTSAEALIYEELTDAITHTVNFYDNWEGYEGPQLLTKKTVNDGYEVTPPQEVYGKGFHEGYEFSHWFLRPADADFNHVTQNFEAYAKFTKIPDPSSSSTSSTGGGGGGGGSSSSSRSSSGNSSSRSTSITSTTVQPVIVSGTSNPNGAGAVPAINTAAPATGNRSGGSGGSNNNVGKTKLISTTGGITDTSKMSATVNGSSDNYVIKISETQEANEMAQQALTAAFGSLDAIRYLPIDISLYDSTGTQKISPIPDGVSINITMPIPDNLAIYGGNAKVACTEGGTLDKIQPKFTVINGVPCMNYTVTHLSPYVIYVDTNNLTATGTLDATPKTGDPIHPKWFLVIGLAAISGIMFLIRDRKETEAEAA